MLQSILHYDIKEKIAEGGMGSVYLAEDTRLKREVALKFLSGDLTADDSSHQRLKNEARAAAALNHSNIAQVYTIEETDEEIFIVMEYIEGEDLKNRIAAGDILIEDKIRIAYQVADGLMSAHKKGVIHRDIKPSNIMINEKGDAKILDFGLARIRGSEHITKEGTTVGTAAYMSPEQARGEAVDHRTDIWSFGVLLYELISGKSPFRGQYEQAVIYSIVNEDPDPLPDLFSEEGEKLKQIINKALEKKPEARFQQMEELLEDLKPLTGSKHAPHDSSNRRSVSKQSLIVGREKECAQLHAAMHQVRSGNGLLVCVTGEPGIGKTALVETFLEQIRSEQRPDIIVKGRCSERLAGTEAFMPFLEILEGLIKNSSESSLVRLMEEKAPFWYGQVASSSGVKINDEQLVQQDKDITKERMKREMFTFLQLASKQQPLIFFIEDLHWADLSTIDLLDYLANRFDSLRVLIVTTYRPKEMIFTDHPFLNIRPDLLSHGLSREIELGFLRSEEVDQYLKNEYPENDFPADFLPLIHRKTGGNPLFMVNLLRYLNNRKVIIKKEGQWMLDRSLSELQIKLPESVKSMIQRKIDHLDSKDRQILNVAAIQGDEFDSAVIHKLLNIDAAEVEEKLQVMERQHGFIKMKEEKELPDRTLTVRYQFIHILYQNVLYELLSLSRRASLSRAAAEALLEFYGQKSQSVASELARLFESARDYEQAIDYYYQASQNAQRIYAYQESLKFLNQAVHLLDNIPDGNERVGIERDILIEKAITLVYLKGYSPEDVRKTCNRVRQLSAKLGKTTPTTILRTLAISNLTVYNLNESFELGVEILENAKKKNDIVELVEAHYVLGVTFDRFGKFTESSKHFEQAVTNYDPGNLQIHTQVYGQDPFVICKVRWAFALWVLGHTDKAKQLRTEALKKACEIEHPFSENYVRNIVAWMKIIEGNTAEKTRKMAEELISSSSKYGLTLWYANGNIYLGWTLCNQGQIAEGINHLREGLSTLDEIGYQIDRPYYNSLYAAALALEKKFDEAQSIINDSLELIEKTGERWMESEVYRRKGELLLQEEPSRTDKARECFQKAIEIAKKQKAKTFEKRAREHLKQLTDSRE